MLSFESTTAPEGKLFFLGALAGLAKAGAAKAGVARAGVARAGAARAGVARAAIPKAPIKSLGGLTVSPSFQKTNNNSTTVTNDYSTNSTVNYNN